MKIIRNNIIPIKGFAAINLFGILFVKKNAKVTERMLNHESIHTAQMKEMLYVFFYLWYFVEWLIRLFTNTGNAYRTISFEREAYANERKDEYLRGRRRYAWIRYMKNK